MFFRGQNYVQNLSDDTWDPCTHLKQKSPLLLSFAFFLNEKENFCSKFVAIFVPLCDMLLCLLYSKLYKPVLNEKMVEGQSRRITDKEDIFECFYAFFILSVF